MSPPASRTRVRGRALAAGGAAIAVAAAALTSVGASAAFADGRADAASWASMFDAVRPVLAIDTRRVIVVFHGPSLADRVAASSGGMSAAAQKAATKKLLAAQDAQIESLHAAGVQFDIRHRYIRTFNGVALTVHGSNADLLWSSAAVASVEPVRSVYPELYRTDGAIAASEVAAAAAPAAAAAAPAPSSAPAPASAAQPTLPVAGASTTPFASIVAVLDTGIDLNHPELASHVAGPGWDAIASQPGVEASADDAHGTQVAGGVVSGAGTARVGFLPIRVLAQQPTVDGSEHVVGTSDDLLAGFEAAVDPDQNGATDDHAQVALAAVGEPYGGFAVTAEEAAVNGAAALGTLTVAATGNDGESGDATGTISAPASAASALAVGAIDARSETRRATIAVDGGLFDARYRNSPLLSRVDTMPDGHLPVVAIDGPATDVVDYLGEDLRSRVAGGIALIARSAGVRIVDQVRAAEDAGAVAVLVSGAGDPALSGVIDDAHVSVPVVGLGDTAGQRVIDAAASGSRIALSVESVENPAAFSVAGFSSRGSRYDGIARPDVVSSGVAVATTDIGRDAAGRERYSLVSGTSIAAAQVAGQAAAVHAAQPSWSSTTVRAAIIGTAHQLSGDAPAIAQGSGIPDIAAASAARSVVAPARVDFGVVRPGGTSDISFDRVQLGGDAALAAADIVATGPQGGPSVSLGSGAFTVTVPDATAGGSYGGTITDRATGMRIPWSVSVRSADELSVPMSLDLSDDAAATGGAATPAAAHEQTVVLGIGGSPTAAASSLGLRAAQRVDVHLVTPAGDDAGVVAHLAYALPGRYTLAVAGVDAAGKPLTAGTYTLRVSYLSAGAPTGPWYDGPSVKFTVTK